MSRWLRLERKQKISSNAFRIRIFLSRSYSFGIETINTFICSRSSLENHTRFQTKMGKVYTRFQTKRGPKPYPLGRYIPMALPGEATRESYYVKFTKCLEKPLRSIVTLNYRLCVRCSLTNQSSSESGYFLHDYELKQGSFLHEHAWPLTCQRGRDQWQRPCCIVIGTKLFTLKACLRLKW